MSWTRLREIALVILVPLVAFLALSELGLRVYLSRRIFYDVEMSRYARALKQESADPQIGHVHRPHARASLMGVDVRINADGFRDDDTPVERGERRRIVFLGDSLTLGWGVAKQDTFESILERELSAATPTEILNFGTGNYNTIQELHLYLDAGRKYRPDAVVVFYFVNDAEPVPQRSRLPWLGSLRIATFYWSRVKALMARWSPSQSFREYYAELYREEQPGWRATREAFLALKATCAADGADLRVVLLPELHELERYPFEAEHALVASFLRDHGIAVLDLAPFFRGERDPQSLWVARDDAHPNARAHRLIAGYSLPFLTDAGAP